MAHFIANLQYMALGMGGVFLSIGIIVLLLSMLTKFAQK